MHRRLRCSRAVPVVLVLLAFGTSIAAQTGQVAGVVHDDKGNPIKAATVTFENPDASPPTSLTTTTDEKGRFSMTGFWGGGQWTVKAAAPGFDPESGKMRLRSEKNAPIVIKLHRSIGRPPSGALASVSARDLQTQLQSADELFNNRQWDQAIAAYKGILASVPALSAVNLQLAAAYRAEQQYDNALAAYNDLLKADPTNEKAKVEIGLTDMEKGDLKGADEALTKAAAEPAAIPELFDALGDVKSAEGSGDEAARWYRRAADSEPHWGRPVFKLATIALDKGDEEAAARGLEQVIAVDPLSPEAAQAKTILERLKK